MKPYYEKEGITIYLGDCRDILPHLGPVDLVLTDPPYNLGKKYGLGTNDHQELETYLLWFKDIFSLIHKVVLCGYLYCSHSDKGIYLVKPILETIGFNYIQTLIWWGKNGYSMQLHRKSWSYRHEPILFMETGDPPFLLDCGVKDIWYTSVIEASRPQSNFKEGRQHPTQKPIKLFKVLAKRTPGEIILDPFMGSGTTLVAAKQLGRKAIGIEIEEKYCEIAVKRLAQGVLSL
ncbi:MAG: site-specific DNA-methyltransferase [Candidatus Helarchaeota archaeon]|nr:site-specific DNA-methyltransferase [Candidatus Helarchaeota archaeon]